MNRTLVKIKKLVKNLVPDFVLQSRRRSIFRRELSQFEGLSNREIFADVYAKKIWGADGKSRFYSGKGTHDVSVVAPYIEAMTGYLRSLPSKPTAVDLGCGDFSVGSQLVACCEKYIACDVVDDLIDEHRSKFSTLDVDFRQIDMARDELPPGDVVFVRQVLQHLSNADILATIRKIEKSYKYLILTEHLPDTYGWIPNIDIVSGPHTRFSFNSGVVLDEAPFNMKYLRVSTLLEVSDKQGLLRTQLYQFR